MFHSKCWIALSFMLLSILMLFSDLPQVYSVEACCKQPPQGPQGTPGTAGKDAPIAFAWAQTAIASNDALEIGQNDIIPFDDPSIITQGISYANGEFILSTGIYRATFEGYVVFINNTPSMGVQFFLNGTPVGTEYMPIFPNFDFNNQIAPFEPPFLVITQAIFEVNADGSIFTVRGIGGDSNNFFVLAEIVGGAAASVKIVKIADSANP